MFKMSAGAFGKLPSGGHAIVRLEVACQEPEGHVRGAMHSGPVIIGFDGQPASELALREAAADGHGELRRLVQGSTLSGVLREARCPVLVGGLAHDGKE